MRAFVSIALVWTALLAPASAQPPVTLPHTYADAVVRSRVSNLGDGRYVVSAETTGDLRGAITFELEPDADSGTFKGRWALVVAYVEDVTEDGQPTEPIGHDEFGGHEDGAHHRDFFRSIRRGTLYGPVSGVTFSGDGGGLRSARLTVANGSMTFSKASGFGSLAPSKDDASIGTLVLNF